MMGWRLWPRTVSAEAYDAICGTVEEVMAERDMARVQRDEALQRAQNQAEEFDLYRTAMNRPPKANGALLDARREIEHLRVDLAEAPRLPPSFADLERLLERAERAIMNWSLEHGCPSEGVRAVQAILVARYWIIDAGLARPPKRRGSRRPVPVTPVTADAPPGSPQ